MMNYSNEETAKGTIQHSAFIIREVNGSATQTRRVDD